MDRGVGARTRTLHDGVIRIRLDSVCGLVVNAFVLRSAERVVMIDAGFPYTADQLLQGLAEVGLEARDVTDLLVTHLHVDHVGGALTLADQWSPRIWVWSGARPAFGDVNAHLERAQRAPDWPNALIISTLATRRAPSGFRRCGPSRSSRSAAGDAGGRYAR